MVSATISLPRLYLDIIFQGSCRTQIAPPSASRVRDPHLTRSDTDQPRLHRQSPSLQELRTTKTRTSGSRNVLPRLLTKIQDMWLLDLRETPIRGLQKDRRNGRIRKSSRQPRVTIQ